MDKLLVNPILPTQFGAIKPPWISTDTFYKLPFNFCDRWCERCKLKNICRVYQKEKEREKIFIRKGIDPKGWKALFLTMRNDFQEIRELLEKEIKRLKITKKDLEEAARVEDIKERNGKSDGLYKISLKISHELTKLLEDIHYYFLDFDDFPQVIKESLDVVTYNVYFFTAKIYRAILSNSEDEDEEYKTYDDKTSAFLAVISIMKIDNALKLLSEFSKMSSRLKHEVSKLRSLLASLNEILLGRFDISFEKFDYYTNRSK